jgi:hydrogenase small subunit
MASLGWLSACQSGAAEPPTAASQPAAASPQATQAPERVGRPVLTTSQVAEALQALSEGQAGVLWLHGQACSGCSVSFLNAAYPDAASVITQSISLEYHTTLSAATGATARQALEARVAAGNYLLVVEGAVPAGMPRACMVGDEPFPDLLTRAAQKATAIVALGTCATFGGVPAAPPNPTGAISVAKFLGSKLGDTPLINLPGCPAHPDWLVGTLVHLLKVGVPPLTEDLSPAMFYSTVIHDRCPEFFNYNAGKYARFFGDAGCLFNLGCLGIRTYADCSIRRWNNRVNWCVEAGGPCIGCARPEFAADPSFPLYRLREQNS